MVLADSHGVSTVLLGMQLGALSFRLLDFHRLWCSIQLLRLALLLPCRCPTTPMIITTGLGSSRFARRYWGNHVCFLFLQLLRCFSSLRSLVLVYEFNQPFLGLPHSETDRKS